MPIEPDAEALTYTEMEKHRALCRALMQGTKAMRNQALSSSSRSIRGESSFNSFLPRHMGEGEDEWKARVFRTVLLPAYKEAVRKAKAKVFQSPVQLLDDVPLEIRGQESSQGMRADVLFKLQELIEHFAAGASWLPEFMTRARGSAQPRVKGWVENIDLQGRNMHVFLSGVFEEAWAEGLSAVLVDHTARNPASSLADQSGRPYWEHIHAKDCIRPVWHFEDGTIVLDKITIRQCISEDEGTSEVNRLRVLYRGESAGSFARFEFLRKDKVGKWVPSFKDDEQPGFMAPFREIPLRVFYGPDRICPWYALPYFEELANHNLEWFQDRSDFKGFFYFAKVPMLTLAGWSENDIDKCSVVGGGRIFYNEKPATQTREGILETTGQAVGLAIEDLKAIEERMRLMSLLPLLERAPQTLGEKIIDTSEGNSVLTASALALQDFTEELLAITAQHIPGAPAGGSVKVNTRFTLNQDEQVQLNALRAARDGRPNSAFPDLSRQTYLKALKVLSPALGDEFDPQEEEARILTEALGEGDVPPAV